MSSIYFIFLFWLRENPIETVSDTENQANEHVKVFASTEIYDRECKKPSAQEGVESASETMFQ